MSTQYQRPGETESATDAETDVETDVETEPAPRPAVEPNGPRSTTLGFANEVDVPPRRHVIDRFDNAAGLFILRLVVAVIMGVHGLQKTQELDATRQQLRALHIPAPDTLALLFGPVEFAIAVALIFGLAVRAAGLGTAVIAISALVLVRWTGGSTIFVAHQPGFTGETELLLAGVGLMLLGVGGGGWGLDRKVRNRRAA